MRNECESLRKIISTNIVQLIEENEKLTGGNINNHFQQFFSEHNGAEVQNATELTIALRLALVLTTKVGVGGLIVL